MDPENSSTLCRVCLEDGAIYPIFDSKNDIGDSIFSKLSRCMKEKIEDVDGFPRKICSLCNDTLETVINFINKYKESSKILQSGLLIVKNENDDTHVYSDHYSEVEIEIKNIKTEPEVEFEDGFDDKYDNVCLIDLIKPLKLKIDSKELTIKKTKTSTSKTLSKNKTNKIASSLLEGEFTWTGDKCLKSNSLQSTLEQESKVKKKIPNQGTQPREIKLKLPKIKKPNPPKLCDICGEVFKNQDKLAIHKRKVHFKNPVSCPQCSRMCVSEYYLKRHIKRRHDTEKNFICATCGRRFAFKGELSNHQRIVHEKHLMKKKMFACKFCDKTYKCAKSIIIHERSVHTGQRPAECTVCGSSFYHEDYLKEHMRLHTGETPFKCPICGRGYAQRGNMKSHLRIHRLAELDATTLSKLKPNYLKLLKDFR
ncbi:zinc finger protein 583-like isoform X2 [Ostrinia furnacalis]|uniref:zinc finger protein 583-like isoform X2 n=1 Tax=Ostrinia furnacalis TaxID=93504 RepID=UPI00103B5023|nr:zinc finger protein 583-like isoform X2 [Ostrinia furnacalis]